MKEVPIIAVMEMPIEESALREMGFRQTVPNAGLA